MKDWNFLYNRYLRSIRLDDGYRWDFPKHGMLINYDEHFLDDVLLQKGEVFADVGANVGAWSVRASPFYQKVYSYEPNPQYFRSLKRNIFLNHCLNVVPRNCALDNQEGITVQAVLAPLSQDSPMRKIEVKTTTLDSQDLPLVSAIKIDAEGTGYRIVQAGLYTILKDHPRIVVEVHTEEESKVPDLLPAYSWEKRYRPMPLIGDWLYREKSQQVFLVGTWN